MAQERRVVTVLFADVVGSTQLGAELDPEDVRALMARYYEIARAVIGEHDGTIEKFIGDAVMAVFGLPRAHGDDAARAVAAASSLRERVAADRALGRLQLRFGVATGEVVGSRDTADGEFLVTGDAVNVAARLQQAAAAGQVLATERTAWDARARFDFGPSTGLEIKGRREPVMVRVLGGPARPAQGLVALPFVGRADELDQLTLTARRTFRDHLPAVVSIVAPAGTGKSRLVEEFLSQRLPGLAPDARIVTAQCLPYGGQLTYWPLRAILHNLVDIPDGVTGHAVMQATADWLGDARDAELLAATVGAESAAPAEPTQLFAAWRAAFAKAAAERPLVVVFEDLHWSSDSLLDLVEFVMDPHEPVPTLIIAIARPELIDRRPTWGGGRRNFVSVYLDPLPEAEIAVLVASVLGAADDEVVHELARRSEGNPFFAGELAHAARERGTDALPDTVQATVLARLDLLDDGQRRLLQVASIFGRAFRPDGVRAIAPGVDGRVDELIDSLVSRDLIRRQDRERYAFRHILIRDVAYSTLPRSERSRLHAAAGVWLEGLAAGREEEMAEIVALHFREAVSNAGSSAPAVTELRASAAKWLLRAADSAVSAAATREAEARLRAALEVVDDRELAADIWARLGDVLRLIPGGFEAYQNAVRLAREPARRLAALGGLLLSGMRYLTVPFAEDEVEAAIAEGSELVTTVNDASLEARFRAGVGFHAQWALQHGVVLSEAGLRRARESAARAIEQAESLGDPNLASVALDSMSAAEVYENEWRAMLALAQRRRAYGPRLSLAEIMDADHMATWALTTLGEPREADRVNDESAARLRPGQVPEWRLSTLGWRMRIGYTLGDWTAVLETADVALAQWRQLGSPLLGWLRVGLRPAVAVARGRLDARRIEATTEFLLANIGAGRSGYDQALVEGDFDTLARSTSVRNEGGFAPSVIGDVLRALADAGRDGTAVIDGLADHFKSIPIVALQVQRAAGLVRGDAAMLGAALDLARRQSDAPTVARVAVELGRLTHDSALVDEGRAALIAMGDLRQLERYGFSLEADRVPSARS